VLDAWSKQEIVHALCSLHDKNKIEANEIYELCGGCIRHATNAITKEGKIAVKKALDDAMKNLMDNELELVSAHDVNDNLNYNRLRATFVSNKDIQS
jgi:hypothetical protein